MNELDYIEDVDIKNLQVKDNELRLTESDLPIFIIWEDRKEYVLKSTGSGGLVLNRKD